MKAILILFVTLFIGNNLFSQFSSLNGQVNTEDSHTAKAKITLDNKVYFTNLEGGFKIDSIPFGTHQLSVELIGYQAQIVELNFMNPLETRTFLLFKKSIEFDDIQIIANRTANEKSVEIGKIPIRPFDLPQSIAIIDQAIIQSQQSEQLSDILKNTNGVYIMGSTGGYQEEIAGRGFAFGSNNTFKNGVRFNNAIMPEVSAIERMEIMKGSTAILFGNVAAGGVLNIVTKKPQFEKGGTITMRAASYDFYKPSFDFYGGLNKKNTIAYRINSTYQKSNSFRDQVKAERFYINPSFLFKFGKKTELTVEGDYLSDTRTVDYGVGAINYQLINVPRNTFLGAPWSKIHSNQASLTATVTHELSKKWQIRSVNSFQQFNNDLLSTTRPNSSSKFVKEDGTWIRGAQRTQVNERYLISQLDLIGKFSTGKIHHSLLIGAEIDQYYTSTIAYNPLSNYDTVNVFAINNETQRKDIPDLSKKTNTLTPRTRTGIYFQDLFCITKKLKVLAGVRFSYLESESNVFTYADSLTKYTTLYDHAFSPRVGIVYQPVKTMSIFSSYSNSFTPNTGVNISGQALAPSLIDQYEVGIKNDLFKGKLSANVTAYQITNSNVAQMVLDNGNTNSNIKELAGEITSKGIEVDVNAHPISGMTIIAGYSYNETRYTKSSIYAVGAKLLYQPKNTFNSSVFYEIQKGKLLKGINFGVTAMYFGERFGGRLTRLNVPNDTYRPIFLAEYYNFDASVGYSKQAFSIRFKVSNIFNALSYNVHDDNSINPIAPRMIMTTLSIKL